MRSSLESILADRVLIVGYGSIGQRHMRVVRDALPTADIHLLRRTLPDQPVDGAGSVYSQLKDALGFAPQLAVVASPASEHLRVATALVAQGCHVLIEKPLCLPDDEDVSLLEARAARPDVHLQVGYNLRFSSSLMRFRKLIHENFLGQVLSVRCEVGQYLPSWRPSQNYRQSVSVQRALGGGVLMELSHELDYLQWIFGRCQWVNAYLGRHSALETDVEDTAQLTLGHIHRDSGKGVVSALLMDFYRHDTTRRCTAICEQGSVMWDAVAGQVTIQRVGSSSAELVMQADRAVQDTYALQWQSFMHAASGYNTMAASLSDAQAVMAVIRAVHQSANAKGARVDVLVEGKDG